ncbi:MAG: hypothetical protein HY302_02385 [Opitutae bacterium]|nr:hypothetical protein [Opitutae bacterium]
MNNGLPRSQTAFALVITLALVALLVLALLALSILVRFSSQISATVTYQTQARQNALLGLSVALGDLQRLAGPNARATGMAGIAGETPASQFRQWCGVWDASGTFLGWLTSGALMLDTPSLGTLPVIQLVEAKSVGPKPLSLTAYADEEYVDAGKVPLSVPDASGNFLVVGNYAYWVGDEGCKVSSTVPSRFSFTGAVTISAPSTPLNIARMTIAFQQFDSENAKKIVSFEQAPNLAYAAGKNLTAANLHDSFHHVTLSHLSVPAAGAQLEGGKVNVNTTSVPVWRALFESYNNAPGAAKFSTAGRLTSAVNTVATGTGKPAKGPFTSIAAFGTYLASVLPSAGPPTGVSVMGVLSPMLTVRSDTFRIRAYGDATNPASDPANPTIESTAYCEAIVQRTPDPAPDGLGRKFVIVYFRWLGPDDV